MENVSQISPYERMLSGNVFPSAPPPRRDFKKRNWKRRSVRFFSLAQLINDTQISLHENNYPFRLYMYENEQNLFMDVVSLDSLKKEYHRFSRDITNKNLKNLVNNIHNKHGLILDYCL